MFYCLSLILVLLFFFPFLDGNLVLAFKDLSRYFYPLRFLMVEQVKAGCLPLWNPHIFCGFPLLATLQTGFFYPLTALYYLLPFNLAFNYYIILHYFLAACFMYALLQHYQLSKSSSFFGGLVFAFSGYLLSVSNMNTSLSSVVWLPLVVLVFDKMIVRPEPRLQIPVMSILLAVMFLGGEPTILYVTFWLLAAYTLVFSKKRLPDLGILTVMLLLAFGLAAAQLLPFIELSRLSDRVVNTGFEVVSYRSFPPRETLNFIFPYFFGNSTLMGNYNDVLLGQTVQDWLISPYLGFLPLVFIFFAFRRRKKALFFAFTGLFGLLLAFGAYTPLYKLFYQFLPGIALIRFPVKYLFLTTFCLTILSALGLDELLKTFNDPGGQFKKYCSYLLPIFLAFSLLSISGFLFAKQIFILLAGRYSTRLPGIFFDTLAQIACFNLQSAAMITVYLFVLLVIFWLAHRKEIDRRVFIGIILLVTVADLFSNGISTMAGVPAGQFSEVTESYRILRKEKGLYRFFYPQEVEKQNRVINGETYAAALLNAKDNLAANWHIPHHLYDFYGYESIRPQALYDFYLRHGRGKELKANLKYLSRYNVKYIALLERQSLPQLKLLRRKYQYGINLYLYENKAVLPRAFCDTGKVKIDEYRPCEIKISAHFNKPGRLFLSDLYYPGWKVLVDGREGEILKADGMFRSVELPAGKHQVRFVYDPWSFKIGLGISAFCWLLVTFCFLTAF